MSGRAISLLIGSIRPSPDGWAFSVRPEGVLILSAFAKRTRRIPAREVKLARHRLKYLLNDER
jgi:hypothetical protein